ncbi:MAG: sigma factor-like helix-turn-helix DNA-binding protein [Planctomycetota bacterium]
MKSAMSHSPAGTLNTGSDQTEAPVDRGILRSIRSAIMQRLSQTERLLIILKYVENMSAEEIALTLDLTVQQVGTMHQNVLSKLAGDGPARLV